MKRGYVSTPGGQIHFRSAGTSGDNLLLLHQTSLSSFIFEPVIPALAEQYRVVALDTPGYGYSDLPPHPYTITEYAAAVVEALDALGWEQTHLVGRLTGATLAAVVAASHPERIKNVVLSGMPDYSDDERKFKLANLHPARFEPDGSQVKATWDGMRRRNPALPLEAIHQMTTTSLLAGERNEDAHAAVFSFDSKDYLRQIQSPTLFLFAEDDYFLDRLDLMVPLVKRAKLVKIPGGRQLVGENPAGFANTIIEFLANPGV